MSRKPMVDIPLADIDLAWGWDKDGWFFEIDGRRMHWEEDELQPKYEAINDTTRQTTPRNV